MYVQLLEGMSPWSETTAGTNSGATATHAAATNVQHFVTGVSGHGDQDATLQIKDGSTVMAEFKIDVSVEGISFKPWTGLIPITPGAACSAVISASGSDCQVNINGFSVFKP